MSCSQVAASASAPDCMHSLKARQCSCTVAAQQRIASRHAPSAAEPHPAPTQSAASRTIFQCNHGRSAAGRVRFSSSITAVLSYPWTFTWPRHSQQHARHASHEASRRRSVASRLLIAAGDEPNAAGLGSCRGKKACRDASGGERAAAGKVDLAEDKGPAAPGGLHVFLLWCTCSSSSSVNGRHGLAPMSAAACPT